jgi:hypothetical protein
MKTGGSDGDLAQRHVEPGSAGRKQESFSNLRVLRHKKSHISIDSVVVVLLLAHVTSAIFCTAIL